jgi:hypothetical protein
MMDILKLILEQVDQKDILNQLGKSIHAKPEQVKKLTQEGLPTLLTALSQNASTPQGALSLSKALDQHKDDNISDIHSFLKGVDTKDGEKILGHILGNKTEKVESKLGASSGLNTTQVNTLLAQLAPLVLAQLGKQKAMEVKSDDNLMGGLASLLGGAQSKDLMGMASKFLDADGDGDIMDDLGKTLGNFFKK